jgi:hypothetical protein
LEPLIQIWSTSLKINRALDREKGWLAPEAENQEATHDDGAQRSWHAFRQSVLL